MLIYGAIMVIIMVARPEGIMGQHEIGPRLVRSLFARKPANEGDGNHADMILKLEASTSISEGSMRSRISPSPSRRVNWQV